MINAPFDINTLLTDADKERIKEIAPAWDIKFLADKYNLFIGDKEIPHHPRLAFMQFCKIFTKGNPPAIYDQ